MRTHWAIFYADRDDLALQFHSRLRPGHFPRSFRHFEVEKSCDKIAIPDWLTLVAIRSDERKISRERAHLANAGEFNRGYLTCQISAILYADRGDRRKSQSRHRAHLVIFADRRDRRMESPGVSPALMTGPKGTVSFVTTRPSMSPRGTLIVEGKYNSLFPVGPVIK